MKLARLLVAAAALFAFVLFAAPSAEAQFGAALNRAKDKATDKTKQAQPKPAPDAKDDAQPKNENDQSAAKSENETAARTENAKNLAKAPGMPKPANTDAELNKLLFQAADDHRLIPRRVVVVDKDWMTFTGARGTKARRIFTVIGRTQDDGSGKCAKQWVQFDSDWRAEKNAWGAIYAQNIGEIVPIACAAIGK